MPLETGDRIPDELAAVDPAGERVPLSRLRGEATLLVFLRHLG
ncbi:hypothetical protein BH20ACT18_BH20ACT18_01550 [soil metagenome]